MEFIEEYAARRFECDLQKDARRVLAACARRGMVQSILSAYEEEALREMVGFLGVSDFFEALAGRDDHYAHGKLDNGRRLLDRLGCSKDEVLLVGDTAHDSEVAAALGIDCVLIPSGHNPRHRLEACGAPVIEALTDVPAVLGLHDAA